MDENVRKPERLPTFTQSRCSIPAFGSGLLETPRGPVEVFEYSSLSLMDVIRDGEEPSSIAVLIYDSLPGQGVICQMDAASARNLAAAMLAAASRIDPDAVVS